MTPSTPPRVRVVGRGRAGGSFAAALSAIGWHIDHVAGQSETISAEGVDLVLLCVPDSVVSHVSARVVGSAAAVVAHTAGSLGIDVLGDHPRRAVLHPLASLPDAQVGAARLRSGITFAISGDPVARGVAEALGGTPIEVGDAQRVAYHAAATIASNHLVALMDQVDRVAGEVGRGGEMYLPLVHQTLDNIERLGAPAALTGPAARGDVGTLDRHRALLSGADVVAYDAMAELCRALAARR